MSDDTKECRSPYCECDVGKCREGKVDRRGEVNIAQKGGERTLLEQYDREQLPGYRAGYDDGRQRGYSVGYRHAQEAAAAHALDWPAMLLLLNEYALHVHDASEHQAESRADISKTAALKSLERIRMAMAAHDSRWRDLVHELIWRAYK